MKAELLHLEGGFRWYVIQTKPRKERVVKQCLHELEIEVFLPWIHSRRRIGSRHHWVLEPLFPGYLFSRLDLITTGLAVRYSSGVKDFVKFGSELAQLGENDLQTLRERCPGGVAQIKARRYKAGEPLKVLEGPFSGLEAVFEKEMKGNERVAVLLELLGRQTRVVLSHEMIARL